MMIMCVPIEIQVIVITPIEKTAYVLGSELWEYDFDDLFSLVKEYVVGVWDTRKQKLYGDDSCPSQLQSLICSWLELRNKWMVMKLRSSGGGGILPRSFS